MTWSPDTVAIRDAAVVPSRPFAGSGSRTWNRVARVVVLAATDAFALLISAVLAYAIWARPMRGQSPGLYLDLTPLVLLFILGYFLSGLYPGFGLGPVETLRRLTRVTSIAFLVLAAFSFALKMPAVYSRVTFALTYVIGLALVPLCRAAAVRLTREWSWWPEPVVMVGTDRGSVSAIRSINGAPEIGYAVRAVFSPAEDEAVTSIEGLTVLRGLQQARTLADSGVRMALVEAGLTLDRDLLDALQREFRHVVLLRHYDDLPVEGLQLRTLGSVVGLEYTNNLLVPSNRVTKRALDVLVAGIGLVVTSPLVLCAMALVKLIDRGPALFFQTRAGLDGQPFAVPKIRTMRLDAEARLAEHLAANPALREEWEARYKLRNDPRLIPLVGSLLRRFSIDELPQLLSVLRGDMSLVGPRPFPDYHNTRFSPRFLELRERVRPGITGLWQVTVRSEGTIDEQEAYDSYYIRNWSVWLDIYILCRTLRAVVGGRGAY